MAKLFPFRPAEGPDLDREPRLVNIDDEVADDVFAALSSDTARDILQHLYEEPTTASEVADAADTSLQNARYHLDKLETAGLVEPVDTWYSSRGTEMTVYAPTSEPLVVAAGEEESRGVLRRALKRVVGAVGILGIASVMIDRVADGSSFPLGGGGGDPTSRDRMAADQPGDLEATGTPSEAADTPTPTTFDSQAPEQTQTPAETGTPTAMDTATQTATTTEGVDASTPTVTEAPSQTETVTRTVQETYNNAGNATETDVVTTTTDTVIQGGTDLLGGSPGMSFFAGGLLVLGLAAGWWYWSRYRPMYRA